MGVSDSRTACWCNACRDEGAVAAQQKSIAMLMKWRGSGMPKMLPKNVGPAMLLMEAIRRPGRERDRDETNSVAPAASP
jgi:hypothetical protein